MSKQIPLANGKGFAVVDDEDYERVSQHKWQIQKRGDLSYAKTWIKGETVRMHRFILAVGKGAVVDHKDWNGLNNRRANLRHCTSTNNSCNRRIASNNKSGVKGVSWCRFRGKWRAFIAINGKDKSLGSFSTIEAATQARDKAAKELHGEFATNGAHSPEATP